MPEQTETIDFEKPENYATVLFVKINPEFNIYLDAEGNTLAIEPLNDDAKSIMDDVDTTEKDYQKVISMVITGAKESGYVKTGGQISISVTENESDDVNVDDILSKINIIATQTITSLNIEVEVDINNPTDASRSTETSKPAEIKKPADTNKPIHKHTYSKATCTKAATCVNPKICELCGITEGEKLEHVYEKFVCKGCGVTDEEYPIEVGVDMYGPGVTSYGTEVYNGETYYCIGGSGYGMEDTA